jgi:hypothetical protein
MLAELGDILSIARLIAGQLLRPIIGTGFGNPDQAASLVQMPKAAMDEYD